MSNTEINKIGIVVMGTKNYGNNLVNMSLSYVLERMGYETMLIFPPECSDEYVRYSDFLFSEKNYSSSKVIFVSKYSELIELNNEFDCFVLGGDQLFRRKFMFSTFDFFSLDWVYKSKLSIGTSFGVDHYEEQCLPFHIEFYQYWLNQFMGFSVREKSGEMILKKELNVSNDVCVTSDPVLLAGKEYLENLCDNDFGKEKEYVASYLLDPHNEALQLIEFVANKYFNGNKKRLENIGYENELSENIFAGNTNTVSGEKWLSLITNCKFLITDSFHGLCLALLFSKKFCVLMPEEDRGKTRIKEILREYGLEDRVVTDLEDFVSRDVYNRSIRFDEVEEKINLLRDKSIKWILKQLRLDQRKCKDNFIDIYRNKSWKFVKDKVTADVEYIAWGAGDIFLRSLHVIRKKNIRYVVDQRSDMIGKEIISGVEVISEEKMKEKKNVVVIVTIDSWEITMDIYRRLKNCENVLGIANVLERHGYE